MAGAERARRCAEGIPAGPLQPLVRQPLVQRAVTQPSTIPTNASAVARRQRVAQRCAQAPKITRVPVEGITSLFGISRWTGMMAFNPVQCIGIT